MLVQTTLVNLKCLEEVANRDASLWSESVSLIDVFVTVKLTKLCRWEKKTPAYMTPYVSHNRKEIT